MKLTRILNELYCRPWLITPTMHNQICAIVKAHVDGTAHAEDGIAEMFKDGGDDRGLVVGQEMGDLIAIDDPDTIRSDHSRSRALACTDTACNP